MTVKKRTIPAPPKASVAGPTARTAVKNAASARPPSVPAAPVQTKVSAKNFSVQPWDCKGEGKRILIYAESGMGKTTLASMAPKPAFIGVDDGGKLMTDETGKKLRHVPGISTFADVRGALQADIYADDKTIVVDQVTALEEWAVAYVLANIPNEKGAMMRDIIQYGWNGGFRHLYDTMKLILQDSDGQIRRGKNVIIIAQAASHSIPNPGGEDFLRAGPRLCSRKGANIEALYCEWADHIFRIDYQHLAVDKKKKVTGTDTRAIFVHPEPHFRAKSRTLGSELAVVAFEDPADDSIWKFLFEGDKNE